MSRSSSTQRRPRRLARLAQAGRSSFAAGLRGLLLLSLTAGVLASLGLLDLGQAVASWR